MPGAAVVGITETDTFVHAGTGTRNRSNSDLDPSLTVQVPVGIRPSIPSRSEDLTVKPVRTRSNAPAQGWAVASSAAPVVERFAV